MALVTVILPIYNAEPYLSLAINSVLTQTFTDFELLLIDDASTDNSVAVAKTFHDERIRLIVHEKNIGLIATLNKAIDLVQSPYVARMDCDDICDPRRLELQLHYLKRDALAKMVCSPILGITPQGQPRGVWPTDFENKSSEQIRKMLPRENCIAHPTVLIDTAILKKYRYSVNQAGSEDWDLWLRLCRDNIKIIKTEEILLKYRIHPTSITNLHKRKQHVQLKSAMVKWRFLLNSLRSLKLNAYVLLTFLTLFKDLGYYIKTDWLPRKMHKIWWFISISPFRASAQYNKMKVALQTKNSRHFFFFPYSHLGGAEKVHAQISILAANAEPFIFITGIDNHHPLPEQFGNKDSVLDAAACLYHPLFAARTEHLILEKIKNTPGAVLFGCNNQFYDLLLSKIPADIYAVDLTHDYDYVRNKDYAEKHLQAYLRNNCRVFISNEAITKTLKFYEEHWVDESEIKKIKLIYNGTEEPLTKIQRQWTSPFQLLYVGRDTDEKRVEVLFALARICEQKKLPFHFTFVGPVTQRQAVSDLKNISYKGVVTDKQELSNLYSKADFILISSVSEGFPLSIMEGMMHGCIPLSTAVGDISFHIQHTHNGFLVEGTGFDHVVEEFVTQLEQIARGHYQLSEISTAAHKYAVENFSMQKFNAAYRSLLKLEQ